MSKSVYKPRPGENINNTVKEMVRMARFTGQKVTAKFNGTTFFATPTDTPEDVFERWEAGNERARQEDRREREAYGATPEGQEKLRQRAEKEAEDRAERDVGFRPFAAVDAAKWAERLAAIGDGYSLGIVRYAARWAWLMEKEMAEGATVAECANETSQEADAEGISGFMYGAAVCELSVAWVHGEELRRWHNKDYGASGEKANESGGVINPALLTMSIGEEE